MSMRRKLVVCKTAKMTTLDVLGGFVWYVVSRRADSDGWPTAEGQLEERFDTEEWALTAARQRLKEGYLASDVFKQVAFSISQGTP